MGFFGKLFGGNKTPDSGLDHSTMHSESTATSTMAKNSGTEQAMEHSPARGPSTIAKDPVCGMDVDVNKAAARSEYQGQTYYFCAPGCKKEFDKNPAGYASGHATGKRNCC